jgi:hypothetical protein
VAGRGEAGRGNVDAGKKCDLLRLLSQVNCNMLITSHTL